MPVGEEARAAVTVGAYILAHELVLSIVPQCIP